MLWVRHWTIGIACNQFLSTLILDENIYNANYTIYKQIYTAEKWKTSGPYRNIKRNYFQHLHYPRLVPDWQTVGMIFSGPGEKKNR